LTARVCAAGNLILDSIFRSLTSSGNRDITIMIGKSQSGLNSCLLSNNTKVTADTKDLSLVALQLPSEIVWWVEGVSNWSLFRCVVPRLRIGGLGALGVKDGLKR
jgi:hypothetical protein